MPAAASMRTNPWREDARPACAAFPRRAGRVHAGMRAGTRVSVRSTATGCTRHMNGVCGRAGCISHTQVHMYSEREPVLRARWWTYPKSLDAIATKLQADWQNGVNTVVRNHGAGLPRR